MSLSEGEGRLDGALRALRADWRSVAEDWRDGRARRFATDVLDPIQPATVRACEAISRLRAAAELAERTCGPRPAPPARGPTT